MRPDWMTIRAPLPEWSWTAATPIFTDASVSDASVSDGSVLSRSRWHAMVWGSVSSRPQHRQDKA